MSSWHHGVRGALTRTLQRTPCHCGSANAARTVARASSFADTATASSRSMTISSAPRVGALASIFADEPGTDMHERRGAGAGCMRGRLRATGSPQLQAAAARVRAGDAGLKRPLA